MRCDTQIVESYHTGHDTKITKIKAKARAIKNTSKRCQYFPQGNRKADKSTKQFAIPKGKPSKWRGSWNEMART